MVIWFLLVFCTGCATIATYSSPIVKCGSKVVDYFSSPEKTFQIETTSSTNDGTPVYLLIRSTDFSNFLLEDYQTIVDLVAHPEEDPTTLASLCLIPGTSKTLTLEPLKDKAIAFYALFTRPGNGWKYLVNTEEDFEKIEVLLGAHEIESVRVE